MTEHAAVHGDLLPRDLFARRTVFVTGGGSGINFGIAQAFARHGAAVAICGRSPERLDGARVALEALGGKVFARTADVRDAGQLKAAIDGAGETLGDIGVLVCGAAGNFLSPAETLSPNGFRTVVDIDLCGSFNAARLAFDQLKRSRGSVVFITAPMAHMAHAYQAHVGAAKAGVEMLMKNLALEWGPFGIRSNSVVPGLVGDTEGLRRISAPGDHARYLDHIPLRRMGLVEDVAQAAVFLASPLATYITGTSLAVDGGQGLPGSAFFNANGADLLAANPRA
ncbi:SDR family oxidoreductase [Phreatobacter stygius]|uniref:SDR family oxidoreductase n=1 Tax=Phreatobacter stygius TaxID=1940610 RepID=A0A4D7B0X5_9HYPH|nr:SDR family oxidoreductase [Phreatobacter stygius]QCI63106.1 SDR family oxidoreductase [Phreatobacter stygius]